MRSNRSMSHSFPSDLLETQTDWYLTYRLLASSGPDGSTAAHRRRLTQLSARIAAHSYWQTPAGTPAARVELKELARTSAEARPGPSSQ